MEDEQVEDELPNPKLRFPTPTLPEDLTQDIPPHHSTPVRSILAHLLDYHCYTALITLQIAMKEELIALSKNHTWDLVTLLPRNLWLVISGSTRLRLVVMGPLSVTKLVLL